MVAVARDDIWGLEELDHGSFAERERAAGEESHQCDGGDEKPQAAMQGQPEWLTWLMRSWGGGDATESV